MTDFCWHWRVSSTRQTQNLLLSTSRSSSSSGQTLRPCALYMCTIDVDRAFASIEETPLSPWPIHARLRLTQELHGMFTEAAAATDIEKEMKES